MATPFEIPGSAADEASLALGRPGPDLDLTGHTTVRVMREDNPLTTMSEADRMRLFIRVLCELVAYGELDDGGAPATPAVAAPL